MELARQGTRQQKTIPSSADEAQAASASRPSRRHQASSKRLSPAAVTPHRDFPEKEGAPNGKKRSFSAASRGQERQRQMGMRTALFSEDEQRKTRSEARADQLEGRHPIREALEAGRHIDKVWLLEGLEASQDREVRRLIQKLKQQRCVIQTCPRSALDRLAEGRNHQGIVARVAMRAYVSLEAILSKAKERGEEPFVMVLDEIQDPHNLGSILRVADAAGMHGVIFPERRSASLDAVVAKCSAGAVEHVDCARVKNLNQALEELKQAGLWIVGTAVEGSSSWSDANLTGPLAIVIGNEGQGMRPSVREHCDLLVRIPMCGAINSLNASVSAGVIAFEALRQRKR